MTQKDFCEMLETTEPNFRFRGIDYQVCFLNGRFLAGLADSEDCDCWFNTMEELLHNWTLNGVRLIEALPEIIFE